MTNPYPPYGDDPSGSQGPRPYDPPQDWGQTPPTGATYQQPSFQGQPYGYQPNPQSVNVYAADNSNSSSLAPVTSLISGLVGFFIAWIPIIGLAGWIFGPLAIVFGILGLRRGKAEHKIMSVIGIITGVITLLWCVGYVLLFVAASVGGGGQ